MKRFVILVLIFSAISLKAKESQELIVEITKLVETQDTVTVDYRIKNPTPETVWICINNNQEKILPNVNPGFDIDIDTQRKILTIGMSSFDYKEMMIDGPFGAIYVPIKGGSSKDFKLSFKFPIWERKVLIEKNENDKKFVSLGEFKQLILKVGYYKKDFNKVEKCCYPMQNESSELKKVSYKWARNNKEEIAETVFDLKAKSDKIRLDIKEVVSTDKELKLTYKISNLSKSDVWVCMSSGEEKINKEMDTGIVKIVSEKDLSLILEVKSIPFDIWTSPLGAFYKLVRKDKSEEFIFTIKSPVVDNSDLSYGLADEKNHKDLKTLDLNDVKDLIIRVGYYTKDLNSTKGCCVNPAKKYPPDIKKVYYDWAKENKEEVVEAKISLKNSESTSVMKP